MKIILVGGGTAGSVSPLLAIKTELKKFSQKPSFYFFGTSGPEKDLIEQSRIPFYDIPAGKLRRYFSFKNFFAPFLIVCGVLKSLWLIKKIKPDIIFSAGSYVSVPVSYAGWILGVKILIHQQDYLPSLSNKLIFPVAQKLTVSFAESEKFFPSGSGLFRKSNNHKKIIFTGNPVREEILSGDLQTAKKVFGLKNTFPTLFVIGGSGGAKFLNDLVKDSLPALTKIFQVIHVTGKNRKSRPERQTNYFPFEFLTDHQAHAIKVADIVVTRAGMATIAELCALKKVAVIIPMPDTHQVANAKYLFSRHAAIAVSQKAVKPEQFVNFLRKLIFEKEVQDVLKKNIGKIMPNNSSKKIATELNGLIKKHE